MKNEESGNRKLELDGQHGTWGRWQRRCNRTINCLSGLTSTATSTMQELVRDLHGLALRRDVPDALGKQQEAWKGIRVVQSEALAA